MPDFGFNKDSLKSGLNLVKTVKPTVGDISFRFTDKGLTLFSFDNRRHIRVEVRPETLDGVGDSFLSDEFYVFVDKVAVFNTELDKLSICVNDESLDIKAFGGGQTRRSTLKKRSVKNKRPTIPELPRIETTRLPKKLFDELLRTVSCSASIKEGKTEDDMRTMQVHFYPEGYAMTSTRYHASVSSYEGLSLDASIISADIPSIRSFISRVEGDGLLFGQDKNKIYFIDNDTKSFLSLSKVASDKPKFDFKQEEYTTHVVVDQELLLKNLQWASLVVERTKRISVKAVKTGDSGSLILSCQKQEADGIPVDFRKGEKLDLDIPVDKLLHIVGFIDGKVLIKYGHPSIPYMMEITSISEDASVNSFHYIASMRPNE